MCVCVAATSTILLSTVDTARWALFGSGDPLDFWQVILKFASPASVSSIFDMEEIQTDIGRVCVFTCVCVYHVKILDINGL